MKRSFKLLAGTVVMLACFSSTSRQAQAAEVTRVVRSPIAVEPAMLLASALLPMDVLDSNFPSPDARTKEQRSTAMPHRSGAAFGMQTLALGTVALTLVGIGRQARRLR